MNKHFVAVVAGLIAFATTCLSQPITPPTPRTAFGQSLMVATNNVQALNLLGWASTNGLGYSFDAAQFTVSGTSNVILGTNFIATNASSIQAAAITTATGAIPAIAKSVIGTNSVAEGTNIVLITNSGVITIHGTATGSGSGVTNNQVLTGVTTVDSVQWDNEGFPYTMTTDNYALIVTNADGPISYRFAIDPVSAPSDDDIVRRAQLTSALSALGGATGTNWGTNLIVLSTSGNDSTAVRGDFTKPFSTFTNAMNAVQNGDTLLIMPGIYRVTLGTASNFTFAGDGRISWKTNVTIRGYSRESTKLLATNSIGHLIALYQCDNIRVQDLTFDCSAKILVNDGMANVGWSVYGMVSLGQCANVTVQDCHFANFNNFGILEGAPSASCNPSTNNILIRGNTFYNGGAWMTNIEAGVPSNQRFDCAAIVHSTWTIEGNQIIDCPRGIEPWPKNPYGGNVWYCAPVVRNNVILNATDFAIGGAYMNGGIFENNYIENRKGTNWQGWPASDSTYGNHGIKLDIIKDAIIRGNYIYGYSNGIFVTYATNVLAWDNRLVSISTPSIITDSASNVGLQEAGPIIPGMGASVGSAWICTNATTGAGAWSSTFLTFPTNTITAPPTLALGSFAFWNSNGLMLWKCWNTNGSTVCIPTP